MGKRAVNDNDLIIDHPILGRSIHLSDGYLCCKCGKACDGDDDPVPLIVWDKTGRAAWVFCHVCDETILPLILPHAHQPSRQ